MQRTNSDMAALNADPTAKSAAGRSVYEAERARLARATIELELEVIDATPERLKLFKRMPADGACMCDSCTKRRLWIAIRRVDKKQEELDKMDALDDLVTKAYLGDKEVVLAGLKTWGTDAVFHQGGPVAVMGCDECKLKPPEEPCYHCGRAEWMRSRKDLLISRKDLKSMPTYMVMPLLNAACWGGHVLLAQKLISIGCPINLPDDMGCTPLHWVTCNGHKNIRRQHQYVAIAEFLLKAKADVTMLDSAMKLPMELTAPPNPPFSAMRMMILKHSQADLDTALLEHCRTGDIAMARRTIAAGADMACGDWLNDTPLHVAITYGHKELIDMLVDTAMTQNRLRELVYSKTVDGLDCFDTAHKWGFPTVAIMLHAFVEQSRVIDKANEILKGGTSSVPMHLKGTLIGQKIEEEIKRQNKIQAKVTGALRARQKREKREAQKEARREAKRLGFSVPNEKSKACVIS